MRKNLLATQKRPIRDRRHYKQYLILFFFLFFSMMHSTGVFAVIANPAAVPGEDTATITLDFKEADINTVLRVMSLKSKINIVAGPEVQGLVTIRLEDVPWEKALQVVLRTYGYVYERDGNIIRVTTRENLAAEPVITQTYILNYTKAAEIQSAVQDMLTERGRIKVAERTNMIVITDIPTNLYTIGNIIIKLDKMTPQAYIDAKVIKTDAGFNENIGIDWQLGGTGNEVVSISGSSRPITFPFDADEQVRPEILRQFFPTVAAADSVNPGNARGFPLATLANPANSTFAFGTLDFTKFSSVLQMLQSRSNTKVISNPRIVVLNNQTANIQVGSDVPLPTFERNETTGSVEITGFSYRHVFVHFARHIPLQDPMVI